MIAYIDNYLDIWAAWSRANKDRLGYAGSTPEYKMMTENAATTSSLKHRGRRHLLVMGDRLVVRSIDPMPCKERRGKRLPVTISDNPIAEAMDLAIASLPDAKFRDAIRLKYKAQFDDATSASTMSKPKRSVSRSTFIGWINIAHHCIDMFLKLYHPELVSVAENG